MQWRVVLRKRGEMTCPSQGRALASREAPWAASPRSHRPSWGKNAPAPSLLFAPHHLDLSAMGMPDSPTR